MSFSVVDNQNSGRVTHHFILLKTDRDVRRYHPTLFFAGRKQVTGRKSACLSRVSVQQKEDSPQR